MKKYITLFLLTVISMNIHAQQKENRVESLRIAFITKRLALTPDEAKTFWPIYELYKKELADLKQKYSTILKAEPEDLATKSEAEADKMLNEMIAFRQAQSDLAKKYIVEFNKAISKKKILLLYKAEEDFKKELIKKLQKGGPGKQFPNGE